MKDVTIVTIDTGKPAAPYYTYDEFYASVRKFGYEPLVLREGYGGLGTKPRIVWKAIRDGLIETRIMCFVDCYDVVMQRDFDIPLLPRAEIIWGAEKNCFPDPDGKYASAFPPVDGPFRYLNSGCAFGDVDAFARLFLAMKADEIPADYIGTDGRHICPVDQEYITQQLLTNGGNVNMELDSECRLVCNLHGVTLEELELRFANPPVVVIGPKNETLGPSSFLHFNGGSKTSGLREPILKHLGYL